MIFGSVCSGIEAASVAWEPLGWKASFFSEIDAFPSAVLAHHYNSNMPGQPIGNGIPNHGDMTKFQEWPDHAIELLVGGTPCQAFSVAGLRAGLADPRGNLTLTYLGVVAKYRPRWVVWENVPGVLSIDGGRAFGAFLGGLAELGYGWAYRVLDAQFVRAFGLPFAVPQRRRRVFVVGCFGDWRRAAAVLFDGASLRGDSPPRREAGQTVAAPLTSGAPNGRPAHGARSGTAKESNLIPEIVPQAMSSKWSKGSSGPAGDEVANLIPVAHALRAEGFDASEDGTGRGTPLVPVAFDHLAGGNTGFAVSEEVAGALRVSGRATGHQSVAIPFDTTQITHPANRSNPQPGDPAGTLPKTGHAPAIVFQPRYVRNGRGAPETEIAGPLTAQAGETGKGDSAQVVATAWAVRRLTPRECERLQGFPDDYTQVPSRGKPAADGPRYKALGNSMAVNVMSVIGERIQMVDKWLKTESST